MTETREISRGEYRKIARKASNLLSRISGLMGQLEGRGPRLPAEWHELHDLMSLTGVIASTAARYAEQAPDPDAPVPYTVAGLRDLDADLDAAIKADNADHAIYADPERARILRMQTGLPDCAPFPGEWSTAPGPDVPF